MGNDLLENIFLCHFSVLFFFILFSYIRLIVYPFLRLKANAYSLVLRSQGVKEFGREAALFFLRTLRTLRTRPLCGLSFKVEGRESKMRLSERRAELVRAMPSVSILGEAKGLMHYFNNQ